MNFAAQFAAELHNAWLFIRVIFAVGCSIGVIPGIVAVLIIRGILQAQLYRNARER